MKARFLSALQAFHLLPMAKVGVAVSGGGDSVALLCLLAEHTDFQIQVLHIDHNLRPESHEDALFVSGLATALHVPCHVHMLSGEFNGNLQQSAREARRDALLTLCQQHELSALFVGHTEDDALENLFMRLGRGSGLAGLVGLKATNTTYHTPILRPLLDFSRDELRAYLTSMQQPWRDDPSNENHAFYRIRVRQFIATCLKPHEKEGLQGSLSNLQRAEDALSDLTQQLWDAHGKASPDTVRFPWLTLQNQHREMQLRLLDLIHKHFHPTTMPPRLGKRAYLLDNLESSPKLPLGGCLWQLQEVAPSGGEAHSTQLVVTRAAQ